MGFFVFILDNIGGYMNKRILAYLFSAVLIAILPFNSLQQSLAKSSNNNNGIFIVEYTIIFNSEGGTTVDNQTVPNNTTINEPVPTKPGFDFEGWYSEQTGGYKIGFPYTVTSDMTFYARWSSATFTIYFDSQGGSHVEPQTQKNNATIKAPVVPTKSGYSFVAWFNQVEGGYRIAFPYIVSRNETFYARWTSFKTVTPEGIKAKSNNYNTCSISWNAVNGANGYKIYRTTSSSSYKLIKTTKATKLTDTKLSTGTTYLYKVIAYQTAGKSTIYSKDSVGVVKPVPSTPASLKVKTVTSTSAKITWNKVSGASGYTISRSTSSKKGFSVVGNVKSVSYTQKRLSKGKTYYYKLQAYRTVGKKKVYSSYSSLVSIKM